MKTIISTLALVAIAIFIGISIKDDPGHVMIDFAGKTIETSLAFFAFSFLLAFILLNGILKFAFFLYNVPEKMSLYRNKQKNVNARFDLTQGLIDLAEGKWSNAEKKLSKLAEFSDAKLINYLAAARAAHHQNAHSRRDAYLKKAIEKNPKANIAVGITQAELQLSHDQVEQALATLNWLLKLSPKHIYVKKLLAKIYIKLSDWQKLIDLLPDLKKHKLYSASQLNIMEEDAYKQRLKNEHINAEEVQKIWKQVPKKLKENSDILYQYCKKMYDLNDADNLENCIRTHISNHWDERIIRLYGLTQAADDSKMLDFSESLLTEHNKSPMLFLTLGRLCKQKKLWGKAKTYFQQSLVFKVNAETYQELAELHAQLDELDDANKMYREGLQLVTNR